MKQVKLTCDRKPCLYIHIFLSLFCQSPILMGLTYYNNKHKFWYWIF